MHREMHLVWRTSFFQHAPVVSVMQIEVFYATRVHKCHSSLEGLIRLPRNNNTHIMQSAVKCSQTMILAWISRNLKEDHKVRS